MMSSRTHILFRLFLTINSITSTSDEFYCWPESERATLTFINNERSMHHLPTIRFIQGYWDSQWALQYVGYLYLKEKLGLNVEFYPTISSGITLDSFEDYPSFYWQRIADDAYDLLLEMWPQPGKGYFYDEGSVVYGGINDIYGQIGQFVPDYVYDELLEGTLPPQLKYNTVLRQKFIDAYTKHSTTDWVKYLNDTLYNDNGTLLSDYLSKGFHLPTYDTPIMWGSLIGYTMSQYNHNMTQYYNIYNDSLGLDWIFCPLLTEGVLSEFVIDLYEHKQPFIANIYTPHADFATISSRTEQFMRFEHIFIHGNVDNSRDAECYSKYQCKEPISPLFKLGNPLLSQRVPEILDFLYDFVLLVDDLYDIIAYRKALDTSNNETNQVSSHIKWLNATCKWLKEHEDIAKERFHQDIIRYDCIEGCGFDYYYDVRDNKVYIETASDGIGGYCSNSSIAPICICTNPYLSGSVCRTHCSGLLGPYYDALNGSYYFSQCNGHGTCDISRQKCTCLDGYSGDGCEVIFSQFVYDNGLRGLFLSLLSIWILILIVSVAWLWANQKYKTVKALSAKMTTLFSLGLTLLCAGTIIYLYHPLTSLSCSMRNYCYGIGAILTIMAPLCKTYRVTMIFTQARNLKKIEIPDKKLLVYLINAVIIEFCICGIYHVLHEVNGGVKDIYLKQYDRIETICNQSQTVLYIGAANYLYIFTLIVILCFFSFKNRQSHKLFKESKCAYFGSFFSLFVFIVAVVFNIVVDDRSIIVTIQASAMLIAVSVVWALFYGVRMYKFGRYPAKRSIIDLSTIQNNNSQRGSVQAATVVPPEDTMQTADNNRVLKRPSSGMTYYSTTLGRNSIKEHSMEITSPHSSADITPIPMAKKTTLDITNAIHLSEMDEAVDDSDDHIAHC